MLGKLEFTMTERNYHKQLDDSIGVCTKCGEMRECTEPDAEDYDCEECETDSVYGLETLLFLGKLTIKPAKKG